MAKRDPSYIEVVKKFNLILKEIVELEREELDGSKHARNYG
jgi:hypothetical protein